MATITEDYVSFETAKLLKEKGFDEKCLIAYIDGELFNYYDSDFPSEYELENDGSEVTDAPTQQMAMKWLREVHCIWISVFYGLGNKRFLKWEWEVYNIINDSLLGQTKSKEECCDTYEEAAEAAIKYCLENLI